MTGAQPRVVPAPALAWLRQLQADPTAADADPVGTACILGLLAHRTPAWTEGYVDLLDRLIGARIGRSPGADPNPERLAPLLVLLGVRAMIAADDRWNRPAGDFSGRDRASGAWTHGELAGHGAQQWPDHPGAALGLLLHDRRYGTTLAPASNLALAAALVPDPASGPTLARARQWELGDLDQLVAAPLPPAGAVVGVDFPAVAFSRAEWVQESLHLRLAVADPQPAKRTTFRLVGTEPRMWYLTGIDGTTMDSAGAAVVLRVPHVDGPLELTAGSY